ncbi:hypothetical protein GOBAR_DD05332 [Gossypium barbadense]|nr:hypothetical protein GOBAR_DD05332 [Gossypium barbadense]
MWMIRKLEGPHICTSAPYELEPQRFRQRFARLESQMSSLPIDVQTWLGSMKNWQRIESYNDGFRLATLMLGMGLRQVKQIEARHVYVGVVRKAMAAMRVRDILDFSISLCACSCSVCESKLKCGTIHRRDLHVAKHISYMGKKFPVIPDVSNWEVPPQSAFEMVLNRSLRRHVDHNLREFKMTWM